MQGKPLNIFYAEPDPDRWIRFDRYPRRFVRRLVRGKQHPGGVMTVAINLMRGLNKLNVPYRFNDYRYINKHPEEIACIIGKPHLLFERQWNNPVILGAGIYSHPIDRPNLFTEFPNVKRFLVPGEWMREMCTPYYGNKVLAWPTGLDTETWTTIPGEKTTDFLIYDKVRWERDRLEQEFIRPLKQTLSNRGLSTEYIRYGNYTHHQLRDKLARAKAVIFLCEHETQGLAYQQILATNTPILAWDRTGCWQDPEYYPERVKYQPVSSVPYWDERCGEKFTDINDFEASLNTFLQNIDRFSPRSYVLENLTLEICAKKYLQIVEDVYQELSAG